MEGAKLRILVVDNDHDTADSLSMLLRHLKHDARACYTGQECLARLDEFRPHVVLLDLAMPNLTGLAVAARMRESEAYRDIPLIALTGYGQAADRQQTLEAGFVRHLLKPATIDQVQEAIAGVQVPAF